MAALVELAPSSQQPREAEEAAVPEPAVSQADWEATMVAVAAAPVTQAARVLTASAW